jgi:hypothetical protein
VPSGHVGHLEVRSRSEPVIGWRYWQLAVGSTMQLESLSQRGFVWRPGQVMVARCANGSGRAVEVDEEHGHRAPGIGCGCGVHASVDLASLHAQALCLRPVPLVVGEVALWGEVITEERADRRGQDHRGQFAYPLRLSVVSETLVGTAPAEAVEGIGIYEVPVRVTSVKEAVGELSQTIMANLSMSRPT